MKQRIQRILAVIDPARNQQWALNKAVAIAAGGDDIEVVAYACVTSYLECEDVDALREAEMARFQPWLAGIIAKIDAAGVQITPRIDWDPDWREAIHIAADDIGADLIVKRASGRASTLSNSDRRVLRTASCDVLLVKREPRAQTRRILVALNPNAKDKEHQKLDEMIVGVANRIRANQPDLEIHAVSAYRESDNFIHPPDLARRAGVDRARAHVREGATVKVISEIARELDVDVVLIGSVARKGLAGLTIGNTAEKILGGVTSDILSVSDRA